MEQAFNLNGGFSSTHVAQNVHARRRSAIDGCTTRHAGYRVSQRKRKRVEEIFGWMRQWEGCGNCGTEVYS
jgi:hypothetical protein